MPMIIRLLRQRRQGETIQERRREEKEGRLAVEEWSSNRVRHGGRKRLRSDSGRSEKPSPNNSKSDKKDLEARRRLERDCDEGRSEGGQVAVLKNAKERVV